MIANSPLLPVVVLTKADLCTDAALQLDLLTGNRRRARV